MTITSLATAVERRVTTDTEGNYTVPLVPPATYRVRVTAGGFNSAVFDSVQVVITETTTVNAELTVAGVIVEPVIVRIAPLIQKTAHSLAGLLSRAQCQSCRSPRATSRRFSRSRRAPL